MFMVSGKDMASLLAAVRQADFDSDEYHNLLANEGCPEHVEAYAEQAISSSDWLIGVLYRLLHDPTNWPDPAVSLKS